MTAKINIFQHSKDFEEVEAGAVLFREGDEGSTMYVVIEGKVDIMHGDVCFETVEQGGIVGEMALIDKGPRSASAIARAQSKVVPVDEKHFMFLVQQTPMFALNVMAIMADRLRRMDAKA